MSNTLRDLVATSYQFGKSGKGVLTSEEAFKRAKTSGTVVSISSYKENVFFFSDDHVFGYQILPKHFVPSTCEFPMNVEPREEVPDGVVDTIEKFIAVFHKDDKQVNTLEELVDYIDSENQGEIEVKPKCINWQPEHFPVGTVVILGNYQRVDDEFHFCDGGNAEVTVMKCVKNGGDSWLIRTNHYNEALDMFQSFNFDHITSIKSRGTGPIMITDWRSNKPMINLKKEISLEPLNKNRYYCTYLPELLNFLVKSYIPMNCVLKEGFLDFFFQQTFVNKVDKDHWKVCDFDKKKAKRFIRQNANRWIKPMKEIRIEERAAAKAEEDAYFKDAEDQWEQDLYDNLADNENIQFNKIN